MLWSFIGLVGFYRLRGSVQVQQQFASRVLNIVDRSAVHINPRKLENGLRTTLHFILRRAPVEPL